MANLRRINDLQPFNLLKNSDLYDAQMVNNFEIRFYFPAILFNNDRQKMLDAQQHIKVSMQGFNLGGASGGSSSQVQIGNYKMNFVSGPAQGTTGGNFSFTIVDFIGADTEGLIERWTKLSYNMLTGQSGRPKYYKMPAAVIEYSGDGSTVNVWEIAGFYLESYTTPTKSYSQTQVKTITCNAKYDWQLKRPDLSNRKLYSTYGEENALNMINDEIDKYLIENSGGPIAPASPVVSE